MPTARSQPGAVVIGAGSAGLAAAAHLQAAGQSVGVLEQGSKTGEQWLTRYRSLRLNTVRGLSGLPGMRIPRSAGPWPAAADFAAYLRGYATLHELRIEFQRRVLRIDRGNPWVVELADGEAVPADVVVVATGWAARPHLPSWPGEFRGRLLHSADYREAREFAGQSVLVVGSGNSGVEIAVELLGTAAEVRLAVRTPPLLIPSNPVLQHVGAAFFWLPDSVKDKLSLATHRRYFADLAAYGLAVPEQGAVSRFARDRLAPTAERGLADAVRSGLLKVTAAVEGFTGDGVRHSDGSETKPDVVIAATGYRPGFDDLVGHLGVLDDEGLPPDPGADGLYFVGAPSLRGDIHMHGHQARRVVRAVRDSRPRKASHV